MSRLEARGAEVVKDKSARWNMVEVMLAPLIDASMQLAACTAI